MTSIRSTILLVVLACLTGCRDTPPSTGDADDAPKFLQPLAAANKLTLYSIDGTLHDPNEHRPAAAEYFQKYPVLGKVEITSAKARGEIVRALKRGTEGVDHGFARCFWPRHALRAEQNGKSVEYVVCFECSWIKVFTDSEVQDVVTNADAQELLNRRLREAGIAIAP
jgi:hypothetical protein